ncbi:MAG: gliding motility-associated C-terminal domain-containing protein [Bacteroidales bacterium]|nr:gliding motility-associated C-terminal domain-containing protein [Bacteroidales bacterium]
MSTTRLHKYLLTTLFLTVVLATFQGVSAQTDTLFWFAAPDLAAGHQQTPIRFCITTGDQPATVTIEQPANDSFTPVFVTMPADSFYVHDLSSMVDSVENTTANTVFNRGFRIRSTDFISCYYESVGNNSEIYTLKGTNALGTHFLVPTQKQLSGSSGYNALSSIEIVATEDSTLVQITAPVALDSGIAADSTVTVMLNRGQSYVVRAAGCGPAEHLGGTVVRSDKPIVVNSSDDSVDSGQGCIDLLGDQLVPVETLGRRYVAVRNNSGFERVFVYPTVDNTTVTFNGGAPQVISTDSCINYALTDTATLIEADKSVAVWQMTATGCEVGGTMLPHMECTGSYSVSHLRPDIERMIVTIVVGTPYVSYFTVNGYDTIITAADFRPLDQDSTLSYCLKDISTYVPMGSVVKVNNSISRFQMGILDGNDGGSCSYGYFCDYARSSILKLTNDTLFCGGGQIVFTYTAVNVSDLTLTTPDGTVIAEPPFVIHNAAPSMSGRYYLQGIDTAGCFRPVVDSIDIVVIPPTGIDLTEATICHGQLYTFYGTDYDSTGTYYHNVPVEGEVCDSFYVLELQVTPGTWSDTVAVVCDSIAWRGTVYDTTGIYPSLPVGINSEGCDSTRHLVLTVNYSSEVDDSILICPGSQFLYMGVDYGGPTSFDALLSTRQNCDSLVHVTLYERDSAYHITTLYRMDSVEWLVPDSILTVCAPVTLDMRDTTHGALLYDWRIYMSDTLLQYADSVISHHFEEGSSQVSAYVSLVVTDLLGCRDTLGWPVVAMPKPTPEFRWERDVPAIDNPEVQFFNLSWHDSTTYLWRIQQSVDGMYDTTSELSPFYHWGEPGDNMTGDYTVRLLATWKHWIDSFVTDTLFALGDPLLGSHLFESFSYTCTDSVEHTITITNDFLQFPNMVSPNGDGVNDIWEVKNLLEFGNYSQNELWIFDRTGTQVYHAKDIRNIDQFWDPNATRSPDGTYYYLFTGEGEYGIVKCGDLIEVLR